MKVALLVPSLLNKAPVIVAKELAQGYVDKGIAVDVFHLDEAVELDFPCRTIKFSTSDFKFLSTYDVIHSHMIRPDLVSAIVKIFFPGNATHFSTVHSFVYEDLKNSYGLIKGWLYAFIWLSIWRVIGNLIVLNKTAESYYKKILPHCAFSIIPNGRSEIDTEQSIVEEELFLKSLKCKFKIIGLCAGLSKIKGIEQVIYELKDLHDYRFLVVGDGPERPALEDYAKTLGVFNRVHFLGYKSNARSYLNFFDFFMLSSRSEGMPLALLEAVSQGVPAVCSDIPQLREIFTDSEVAFFQLDTPGSISDAIQRINSDRDFYIKNAYCKFKSNYSTESMAAAYLSLYIKSLK